MVAKAAGRVRKKGNLTIDGCGRYGVMDSRGFMKIWNLPVIDVMKFSDVEEKRDVVLVTNEAAFRAVEDHIRVNVSSRVMVDKATERHWQSLGERVDGDVVYAVGGGLAVDAAKYIGKMKSMPVVSLPTAITVDAFFTWAAGIREDGCVKYIETGAPERVVIDLDVLSAAPDHLRAAGICDLLSIATGSWDWRFARDQGRLDDEVGYQGWADRVAESILESAIDCAPAAGDGEPDGLKQLVDCLALEVQLCNQIGHSRPEEGTEHYFAYSVEHRVDEILPHGELVGPGILIAAHLQGQNLAPLKRALNACNVPLSHLPEATIRKTLKDLPAFVKRHGLPFGIAHLPVTLPSEFSKILS